MRLTTSFIFAALAALATVQALPANLDTDKQDSNKDVAPKDESHAPAAKNKITGLDGFGIGDIADSVTSEDEEGALGEEGSLGDDVDDVTNYVTDELLDDCLDHDFELDDCPVLGDDFDLDECLLLPRYECIDEIRDYLDEKDVGDDIGHDEA